MKAVATPYVKHVGFEDVAGLPVSSVHEFKKAADGQMEHHTDGKLRATIPPESFQDYFNLWPAAGPVMDYIKSGAKTIGGTILKAAEAGLIGGGTGKLVAAAVAGAIDEATSKPAKKKSKAKKKQN